MTRTPLRIALLVTATLGLGVHSSHGAQSTTPTHKKNSASTKSATAKPKSATGAPNTTASKSSSAPKSSGTASGKATTGKIGAKKSASSSSSKHGAKKSTGGRQRGQMAPTPERITEIQEALSKNGAMSSAPSGKWDDSTADAMRKFQAAHGLNPTGKLDAQTLNHLGLGSSTAGMAPPAPTVRTSSATLPADIQQ
jgi:peptidoglycan hydrolase-like protein with peptidoglycan-binding domain